MRNQVANTVGKRPGFARPRSRQGQHRPLNGSHSLLLSRV
jgi:hypothetical protein